MNQYIPIADNICNDNIYNTYYFGKLDDHDDGYYYYKTTLIYESYYERNLYQSYNNEYLSFAYIHNIYRHHKYNGNMNTNTLESISINNKNKIMLEEYDLTMISIGYYKSENYHTLDNMSFSFIRDYTCMDDSDTDKANYIIRLYIDKKKNNIISIHNRGASDSSTSLFFVCSTFL